MERIRIICVFLVLILALLGVFNQVKATNVKDVTFTSDFLYDILKEYFTQEDIEFVDKGFNTIEIDIDAVTKIDLSSWSHQDFPGGTYFSGLEEFSNVEYLDIRYLGTMDIIDDRSLMNSLTKLKHLNVNLTRIQGQSLAIFSGLTDLEYLSIGALEG